MLIYKDELTLVEVSHNGFGDKVSSVVTEIDGLFLLSSGTTRSGNVEALTSDAHAYLDIDNEVITSKGYRLEGMYLKANPFAFEDNESWYKIVRVIVGQKKLLDNEVDNVHVFLQKVSKPL